jgi:hypothetical protein
MVKRVRSLRLLMLGIHLDSGLREDAIFTLPRELRTV